MPSPLLRYTAFTILALCLSLYITPIAGLLVSAYLLFINKYKNPHKNTLKLITKEQEGTDEITMKRVRDIYTLKTYILETRGISEEKALQMAQYITKRYIIAHGIDTQKKLGITDAEWICMRPGCDHEALDGKRFKLNEGMPFNGKCIFPGDATDCGCIYSPVIKELE